MSKSHTEANLLYIKMDTLTSNEHETERTCFKRRS